MLHGTSARYPLAFAAEQRECRVLREPLDALCRVDIGIVANACERTENRSLSTARTDTKCELEFKHRGAVLFICEWILHAEIL